MFTFITSSEWAAAFSDKQTKSAFFHLTKEEKKSRGSPKLKNVTKLESSRARNKTFQKNLKKKCLWTWESLSLNIVIVL